MQEKRTAEYIATQDRALLAEKLEEVFELATKALDGITPEHPRWGHVLSARQSLYNAKVDLSLPDDAYTVTDEGVVEYDHKYDFAL